MMAAAENAARRARILVVDDSSLVRLYYVGALEKAGFEVEQAINGLEATEKVLTKDFELLIVDINMPGMDGLSFVKDLRRRKEHVATVPILMITTEAGEQDIVEAREAGVNYYLIKPISEDDLVRYVSALAGQCHE
jgi:two-component system, chemotaxis family, chemotaxis protein CheY